MPAIYDKLAAYYDWFFKPLDRRFLAKWRAEALSMLPRDADILEVGAGTGLNFPFYPPHRTAVASEISFRMLEFAAGRRAPSIRLVQADAHSIPFADNSFDAAFATLVFCSIPQPEKAFAELVRCIRPGGSVVLLEHVRPHGVLGPVFDLLSIVTVATFDDHFNRETARIAADSGLTVTGVREKAAGAVNLITCKIEK